MYIQLVIFSVGSGSSKIKQTIINLKGFDIRGGGMNRSGLRAERYGGRFVTTVKCQARLCNGMVLGNHILEKNAVHARVWIDLIASRPLASLLLFTIVKSQYMNLTEFIILIELVLILRR